MLIEPRRNVSKVVLSLAGNPFDGAQGTVAITTLQMMLIEPRRNVSKVVLSLSGNPFDGAQGTIYDPALYS